MHGMANPMGESSSPVFMDEAGGTDLVYDAGVDTLIAEFDYELDLRGNRIEAVETDDLGDVTTITWGYDDLDRLISETSDSDNDDRDYADAFTYDLASNRLMQTHTSASEEYEITYIYDVNDRLRSEKQEFTSGGSNNNTVYSYGPSDAYTVQTGKTVREGTTPGSGNLVSSATYSYDARGRMVQVEIDSDGDTTIDSTVIYEYDDNGRRVSETVDDGSTQVTRTYLFDPQNHTGYAKQVEEWVDDGSGAALHRTFTIGHMLIAQHDVVNGVLSFVQDGHGNTRALLDAAAAVVQRFAFDAFGETLAATGYTAADAAHTPWLQPDGAYSPAAGLTNHLARWRRGHAFLTLDSYAGNTSDPLSLHKYLYAHGNPVMGVDPSGMFTLTELLTVRAITKYLKGVFVSYVVGKAITAGYLLATQQSLKQFKILEWTDLLSLIPGAAFAAPARVVARLGGVALAKTGVGAFVKAGSLVVGKYVAKQGSSAVMKRLVDGFARTFAATGGRMNVVTATGQKLFLSAKGFQHIVESHVPKYFDEAVRANKKTTTFFPTETSASRMLDMLAEATQKVGSEIVPNVPQRVTLNNGLSVQFRIWPSGEISQFFPLSPQAGVFTLADLKNII